MPNAVPTRNRYHYWVPTPEEIRKQAAIIRQSWSDPDLRKRLGLPQVLVLTPEEELARRAHHKPGAVYATA